MQHTPKKEVKLSWTCVKDNRLTRTQYFLRKTASGREGSVGGYTTDLKAIGKSIAEK